MTSAELEASSKQDALHPQSRRFAAGMVLGLLVLLYLAVTLLIPYKVEVGLVDEPIFASSAFEFANSGQIVLEDLSAPTAVFDTVWGGLFARALGTSFASLRLSSIVLVALSAISLYWLCRLLGGSCKASLCAMAAYLFNPLSLTLAYSFQTDAHALALGVIATGFFVAGFKSPTRRGLLFLAGSAFTALAFLSRQQGLVVGVAALFAWLLKGSRGRERWVGAGAIVALPLAVFVGHGLWIRDAGEPLIRSLSVASALELSWLDLIPRIIAEIVPLAVFAGLFLIGLVPLLRPSRTEIAIVTDKPIWPGLAIGALIVSGAIAFGYLSLFRWETWVTSSGFGGVDRSTLGWRPELLTQPLQGLVALALLGSVLIFSVRVVGHLRWSALNANGLFLILSVTGFIGAAFLSSLAFHGRVLDRYWLPLLPLLLAGSAALARDTRRNTILSMILVAALGAIAVIGVRDAFVATEAVSEFADDAVAAGISAEVLDGGAGWLAKEHGITDLDTTGFGDYDTLRPWWVLFYASHLQPEYAIALEDLEGYEVLDHRPYSSWLSARPTAVYLIRREQPTGSFYLSTVDF